LSASKTRIIAVTLAAVTALSLAACSSTSSGSSPSKSSTPYRILVLGSLSAAGLADNASVSVNSAKAGVDVVNKEGGVDGHQIKVTVVDDKGDPTTAVTAVRAAINSSTPPDMVMQTSDSTVASAVLPIVQQAGILSYNIGPTATSSNPSTQPLNFDLSPGPSEYMKGFIGTLKAKGYKTLGILHGGDAYGSSFGQLAQSTLEAAGFKITSNQSYDEAALDMTAQVQTIQSTNPDALILDAYGAPVGYTLKSIQKVGWDVPILADNSIPATPLVSTAPPAGILGTSETKNLTMEVFASTKYDASATLVNQAVKAMLTFGPIKSTLILAYPYDGILLTAAAAKAAHSIDSKAIAAQLVKASVDSSAKTAIIKDYGFTSANHSPSLTAGEFAFIAPAKIVNGQFK
jgi:branched-chain amino acid transport system substrate-binding protein